MTREIERMDERMELDEANGAKWDWMGIVFLDRIGVDGLSLSEVILKEAEQSGQHLEDANGVCHEVCCQTLAPMAVHLEQRIAELEAQLTTAREALKRSMGGIGANEWDEYVREVLAKTEVKP